jgi:hypothetical protein
LAPGINHQSDNPPIINQSSMMRSKIINSGFSNGLAPQANRRIE